MGRAQLSLAEARRVALAAQGFSRSRPARPNLGHVRRVINHTRLIQIDFVNVLIPAHYQIPFSRLGPYDHSRLDELVYRRQEWTEQWAHEASIIPMDMWPLLRYRMASHRPRPWGFVNFLKQHPDYLDQVMRQIQDQGPTASEDLPTPKGVASRIEGAWIGTVQRAALEALFGQGLIAAVDRRKNFARVYDLAERVIPAKHFKHEAEENDARRELLSRAAQASGLATLADLADYFRMPITAARPRIAELVEEGVITEVQVGNDFTAYLHRDAVIPRKISARALLSPFDPLVWFRPRLRRLYDFDYRLEFFIPAAKRKWGYYVMPFLLDEKLVARVDLKADRSTQQLKVLAAYCETDASDKKVAGPLAAELKLMAAWLGFDSVRVGRRGNLARVLSKAL